jgi:hypothetical protein
LKTEIILVEMQIAKVKAPCSPDCKSRITGFGDRSPRYKEWDIYQKNFTKGFKEPRLTYRKLRFNEPIPEVICPPCSLSRLSQG